MIEIKNITKSFGKKSNLFIALDDISFEIPEGFSVAIVGKSGSGKSTLMHAISGLDKPEAGEVLVDGKDLLKLNSKETDAFRAKSMGFVFQSFFIQGNETCFDNVSLALEINRIPASQRKKLIDDALKAVELSEKAKVKAKNLSGGQKQRLAIARAIVNKPKILFADEPTGNLDTATSTVIENLLLNYSKKFGATLIIVTHDIELAKKCDQQVLIKDGKITNLITKRNRKEA